MTSSFDDKVYDYIKDNSVFDDLFPIGSVVRRRKGSPPTKGTWKIQGVYGNHVVTGDTVNHYMSFEGKFVSDFVLVNPSSNQGISLDYTPLLGSNFKYIIPEQLLMNTEPSNVFTAGLYTDQQQRLGLTYYLNSTQAIMLTKPAGTYGLSFAMRIELTGDLESLPEAIFNDENIFVEYLRTA